MNHPDTHITDWRDITGLTAEQIARLEDDEQCPLSSRGWLLEEARRYVADNLLSAVLIGDVPRPPDAQNVERWKENGDGRWYREFTGTRREREGEPRPCDCGAIDCAEPATVAAVVGIVGVQFSDYETHRWVETVWLRDEAAPADIRALADALNEAADEIETLQQR